MCGKMLNEHACAVLSLTTQLAWTSDMPKLFTRAEVRAMLDSGTLTSLVLREGRQTDSSRLRRAEALLTRVRAVHAGIEAYAKAGFTLLMPGEAAWPQELDCLGMKAPLFLFAKGNIDILSGKKIAVAGSRRIEKQTKEAAVHTGRQLALEGAVLVTGGAQGVDSAALYGALEAGGSAIIVPAMPVAQLLHHDKWAQALKSGRLLFLCDALPDEPFSAAKALGRNHTIYALGDAALVVAARVDKGGSWRGAMDCMRGGWSPVYAWDGATGDTEGNRALCAQGAKAYTLGRPLLDQIAFEEQVSLFSRREEHSIW